MPIVTFTSAVLCVSTSFNRRLCLHLHFSDVTAVFQWLYSWFQLYFNYVTSTFQWRCIYISVTLQLYFSETHTCNCWCLHVNFGDGYSHGWRGESLHVRPCSCIAMGDLCWRQAGTLQKGWQVFSSYFLPSVAPSLLLKPKKRVMTRRRKRKMDISCPCHFTAKENVR